MNNTHWQNTLELFLNAIEIEPDKRALFLDQQCAEDCELKSEVAAMIRAHERCDDFLDPPTRRVSIFNEGTHHEPLAPGSRLGPYAICHALASGGMGEVYRAQRADDQFNLDVAIKIVRRRVATPEGRRQFQRERQALASLEHPGISRIIDGGTTADGRPYVVMEYVPGVPIDEWCSTHHPDRKERMRLLVSVCEAVACAHQNLIVHRDIKPANIIVRDDGTAKLIDFGIACLIENSTTQNNEHAGIDAPHCCTPEYASPEQLRNASASVACDVYALGVVLYEILTEQRFNQLDAVENKIRDSELPPDLMAIITKATHPEPNRRYASVNHLADDLRNALQNRPVHAHQGNAAYRWKKRIARHKPASCAIALAMLAVMTSIIGLSAALIDAHRANQRAEQLNIDVSDAQLDAQAAVDYLEQLLGSASPYHRGRTATVVELLDDAQDSIDVQCSDRPGAEARIRLALARTHQDLFLYEGAIPHVRKALEYYEQYPEDHAMVIAECLALLGRSLADLSFSGRTSAEGSVAMQRRALQLRRQELGDHHPLVAESIHDIGLAVWAEQKNHWRADDEVLMYLQDAIDRFDTFDRNAMDGRAFDAQHRQRVADAHVTLAHALRSQRDLNRAVQHYRIAIEAYEQLPGRRNPYALHGIHSLARLLSATGRPDEAIQMLELYRDSIPDEATFHEAPAGFWELLVVQLNLGRNDQLVPALREAVEREALVLQATNDHQARQCAARLRDIVRVHGLDDRDRTLGDIIATLARSQCDANDRRWIPYGAIVATAQALDGKDAALAVIDHALAHIPDEHETGVAIRHHLAQLRANVQASAESESPGDSSRKT